MFERYVPQARRAIFFAALAAALENAYIGSEHLLVGLLCDADSRANTLFRLRELLPERVAVIAGFNSVYPLTKTPTLADDCKRILAWTAFEAGKLNDYWIDTEHLLLGILKDQSAAAHRLNNVGVDLAMARQLVANNKPSRPDYGTIPRFWRLKERVVAFFS